MKKQKNAAIRLLILLSSLTFLIFIWGCDTDVLKFGHKEGKGTQPAIVGTMVDAPFMTVYPQFVPPLDGDGGAFIGTANYWDIQGDFELNDGFDDQFDGALQLSVGSGEGVEWFPSLSLSEIHAMTPVISLSDYPGAENQTVSDGGDTSQNPIEGSYSAYILATPDSRISQTLDLTSAVSPITLTWEDNISVWGNLNDESNTYNVVLRALDGTLLETLFTVTNSSTSGIHNADISSYAGQQVVLSFEISSYAHWWPNLIDSVSVVDSSGTEPTSSTGISPAATEFVINGTFETGNLSGWTVNNPSVSFNIITDPQTVGGLDVTRSFFTLPGSKWARWADTFTNNTASPITTTINYDTDLGSDSCGIIYYTPNTGNKALSSWDGDASDRDIGIVFGNASSVDFLSDDDIGCADEGSDTITVTYDVTVNPGQTITIVQFIVMNGVDTGYTATSIDDRATDIDNVAQAIVNNFWNDPQYRDYLTQSQMDTIYNF